ncbi:polysaccharide deacetylase [Paenibacillus glufosinatiresistens]|uniref:polysaccharide deacetylase n=1 Tax=Paenibacillus glufosinatiresistens TaxID=3070657 RepID=UPI00286E8892|nr:polysaccharide deacetylase family protein [Paenibacillus sp. YX.27]
MRMGRGCLALLVFVAAWGCWNMGEASAAGKAAWRLGINDKLSGIPAEQKNGSFFVPVKELAEQLELTLTGSASDLTLAGRGGELRLLPGSGFAVNMTATSAGTLPMYTANGRLMLPVKVATQFGYSVSYRPELGLLRVRDREAKLSDAEFAAKYDTKKLASAAPAASPAPSAGGAKPGAASSAANGGTKPASSGKVVYLTFDDGPSATTDRLLDLLDEHGAKATFFMLGPHIAAHTGEVKRMVKAGNAVGLHGMSHVKSKFYASPASALNEMNRDNAALQSAAGITTPLIRTPYGSKPYLTKAYRDALLEQGFLLWDWNVDSLDWKYKTDSDRIYNRIMTQIAGLGAKTPPVILMHDQAATLKVLPRVLNTLDRKGYTYGIITRDMAPLNFWKDVR